VVAEAAVAGRQALKYKAVCLVAGVAVVWRVDVDRAAADRPLVRERVGDDRAVNRQVHLVQRADNGAVVNQPVHRCRRCPRHLDGPRHIQVAVGRVGGVHELVLAVA